MFSKVGKRLRAFVKDFWNISFGPIFDFIADRLMDAVEAWGDAMASKRLQSQLKSVIRWHDLPLEPQGMPKE
jgi:hypothetical protein